MVIFDIPESERYLRQKLRALLRELKFTFVQQSVWKTNYDVSQYLKEYLQEEGVDKDWVQVYESVRIS
jgi:CRISPR-associated endonuclease Cas2